MENLRLSESREQVSHSLSKSNVPRKISAMVALQVLTILGCAHKLPKPSSNRLYANAQLQDLNFVSDENGENALPLYAEGPESKMRISRDCTTKVIKELPREKGEDVLDEVELTCRKFENPIHAFRECDQPIWIKTGGGEKFYGCSRGWTTIIETPNKTYRFK